MKIVVTGATGFIGSHLVRRLVSAGHAVIAWSRDPQRAAERLPARCRVTRGGDLERCDPAELRGVDAVVNLAGESVAGGRWSEARKRAIRTSRVDGTRSIVAAIASLAPEERPKVLVSASAIGFYGDRGDELLNEDSTPGEGFLAEVCRAWEGAATVAERLGVRVVLPRIGVVLGPDGGALAAMLTPFRLGLGGRLGDGAQWMSWIHLDDVVDLLIFALEREDVRGALNAVAPEAVRNRDFTRVLGRVLGRPTLFPVPAFALRLLAGEMSEILLGSQRVAPKVASDRGFSFSYPSLEAALTEICRDPTHRLEREQLVRQPRDQVFPFFSDARNLERITPDFLGFEITSISTPDIRQGTLIDYRLRLHGFPVRWRTRIEEWQPEERFVDIQLRGPYAYWHHTHEFEPVPEGTIVRDRVRYRLPLGVLGDLIAGRLVARDVEQIFSYRRRSIEKLIDAGATRS